MNGISDFSKKQLEKYGWSAGKGLGKDETGITLPVKAKLKLNSHGIGYDVGEQFKFNWWEHVFNKAAKNLSVDNKKDIVSFNTKRKDLSIQSQRPTKFSKKDLHLGTFVKAEILTADGVQPCLNKTTEIENSDSDEDEDIKAQSRLTEDEVFIKSGGLTAHKAARHGHRMSGKLSRVELQDRQFLEKVKSEQTENIQIDDKILPKRKRKLKRNMTLNK